MKVVKLIVLLSISVLTACATKPYDYTALKQSKPTSILVIPPNNQTVEVNAPYVFLSTITQPLAEKGYYVYPVSVIDNFMKENGLPTPAEMNAVPLDKLTEIIGPDAVLYTEILEWGQKYQLLSSKSVVSAKMKLVDAKTGVLLWNGFAYAEQASGDGGGGIAGVLLSAVVEQVVGSIVDRTPQLSRLANNNAIDNRYRGLLDGPYLPKSAE